MKENRRMSTCNRLDLQTLGSQPVMPKNLPDHWLELLLLLLLLRVLSVISKPTQESVSSNFVSRSGCNIIPGRQARRPS